MNGPEHYREAERLLAAATLDGGTPTAWAAARLAAAQAHATLALAAATAAGLATTYDGDELFERSRGWAGVV